MPIDHKISPGNYQNLFVAKLPLTVSDADLLSVFEPFGPSSATVMLDPVSGRSKGFAFVLFPSESQGRHAASTLDKRSIIVRQPDGEAKITFDLSLFPSKHSGKEVAKENECLYIRNIPNTWPMAEVEGFIARHGKPVYSAVRNDHLGSPVWVVFVEYDSIESARSALQTLHGLCPCPNSPPILAKYAESDEIKKIRRDRKIGCGDRTRLNAVPIAERDQESNVPSAIVGEGSYCSALASVNGPPKTGRILASQQVHNPCHATRYDASGVPAEALKITVDSPTWSIPRPRSQGGMGATHPPSLITQLPLPRSKQIQTLKSDPAIALPSATILSGLGSSIRSVASTSVSSNNSKVDSVRPSKKGSGLRFQYNPYSIDNTISISEF